MSETVRASSIWGRHGDLVVPSRRIRCDDPRNVGRLRQEAFWLAAFTRVDGTLFAMPVACETYGIDPVVLVLKKNNGRTERIGRTYLVRCLPQSTGGRSCVGVMRVPKNIRGVVRVFPLLAGRVHSTGCSRSTFRFEAAVHSSGNRSFSLPAEAAISMDTEMGQPMAVHSLCLPLDSDHLFVLISQNTD